MSFFCTVPPPTTLPHIFLPSIGDPGNNTLGLKLQCLNMPHSQSGAKRSSIGRWSWHWCYGGIVFAFKVDSHACLGIQNACQEANIYTRIYETKGLINCGYLEIRIHFGSKLVKWMLLEKYYISIYNQKWVYKDCRRNALWMQTKVSFQWCLKMDKGLCMGLFWKAVELKEKSSITNLFTML